MLEGCEDSKNSEITDKALRKEWWKGIKWKPVLLNPAQAGLAGQTRNLVTHPWSRFGFEIDPVLLKN